MGGIYNTSLADFSPTTTKIFVKVFVCILVILPTSRAFSLGRSISTTNHHRSQHASVPLNPRCDIGRTTGRISSSSWTLFSSDQESTVAVNEPASTFNEEKDDNNDEAWIPIASASCLTGLGPQRIIVMGVDLVVWHSEDSKDLEKKQWSVMMDACPHRLAPLSQGRVDPDTGCIECPYHGWQFEADGSIAKLPQSDTVNSTSEMLKDRFGTKANAQALPVHLNGDLIFAFLPPSLHGEMFPQSLKPEQMYPAQAWMNERNLPYFSRDLPYSADFLVENFMDPGHVPFAHHSLQSVRSDGAPIPMSLIESNFTHVEVSFQDKSRGKDRDGVVSFQRPTLFHFRLNVGGKWDFALPIHVVPVQAGKSRVIFQNFPGKVIPMWLKHAATNRFLNTDTWIHDAERALRKNSFDKTYLAASESDRGVTYFRQWWSKFGFQNAPPNTFGAAKPDDALMVQPALTRHQQIDPWTNHAQTCGLCRTALRRLKRVQWSGLVLALASAMFMGHNKPVRATLGAVTGLFTFALARRTATVIEGTPHPSAIPDRSVASEAK